MKFVKILVLCLFMTLITDSFAQVSFTEFDIHTSTSGPAGIYCCDLDDDDDMDILVAVNQGNSIVWFENEGTNPPLFTRQTIATGMTAAHSVHANDIDNDGDLDVLGTTYGSAIYWFRNDGGDPLEWTRFTITTGFTQAHEVHSVDIDGDGDIDVLGASSGLDRVTLWYNEGGDPIEWTPQAIDNSCEMAKSVNTADFNGDGRLDIVSAAIETGDIYWYKNEIGIPMITWTAYPVDLNFGGAHYVHPVDINQDGYMDIVAAGYLNHQIAWWRNNGENPPTWTKQTIATQVTNACIAKSADIDGDGFLDVVATEQGDSTISWFRNDGEDPIDWTTYDITTSFLRPWPLDLADLDDDGDIDVVSASSYNGSNEVKWWRNEGDGTFIEENAPVINDFNLRAYPNPFNPATTIKFTVGNLSNVKLEVYNIHGQLIKTIIDSIMNAGEYEVSWSGVNNDGLEVCSGIYFIKCEYNNQQSIQRIIKLK